MAEINDREAFVAFVESVTRAREACRTLGLNRSDKRWIGVAALFDNIRDNAAKLMHTPASRSNKAMLFLPPHLRH